MLVSTEPTKGAFRRSHTVLILPRLLRNRVERQAPTWGVPQAAAMVSNIMLVDAATEGDEDDEVATAPRRKRRRHHRRRKVPPETDGTDGATAAAAALLPTAGTSAAAKKKTAPAASDSDSDSSSDDDEAPAAPSPVARPAGSKQPAGSATPKPSPSAPMRVNGTTTATMANTTPTPAAPEKATVRPAGTAKAAPPLTAPEKTATDALPLVTNPASMPPLSTLPSPSQIVLFKVRRMACVPPFAQHSTNRQPCPWHARHRRCWRFRRRRIPQKSATTRCDPRSRLDLLARRTDSVP